jgi:hypothetical protein
MFSNTPIPSIAVSTISFGSFGPSGGVEVIIPSSFSASGQKACSDGCQLHRCDKYKGTATKITDENRLF